MSIDDRAITDSLRHLASVQQRHPDPADALAEVVAAASDVFGMDGTAFMMIDPDRALRSMTSSDPVGKLLETAQERLGQGPCYTAFAEDVVITCDDINTDARWPALRQLLEPLGIRAVLGVPVHVGGGPVGVLDIYQLTPHKWTDADIAALTSFGRVIEGVLATALSAHHATEMAQQLQYALDHRVTIERAVGYLMARRQVDAVTAFDTLRRASRNSRRKVAEVAAGVLAGERPD